MRQSTAEESGEVTVAHAAPGRPMWNLVMKRISRTMFRRLEKIRNTSDMNEFPMAAKNSFGRYWPTIRASTVCKAAGIPWK